jgi:hypothetical protein
MAMMIIALYTKKFCNKIKNNFWCPQPESN